MWRKTAGWVLIFSMILTAAGTGSVVSAASETAQGAAGTEASAQEERSKELEDAIVLVKNRIGIPSRLSEFTYYVSETDGAREYRMVWTNRKETESIHATVRNGQITGYEKQDPPGESNSAPKYSKKKLRKKAEAFLKKAVPEQFAKVRYQNTTGVNTYAGTYGFRYQRMEQGVFVQENQIYVEIRYDTAEVAEMDVWFDDVDFPDASGIMSKKDAKKAIKSLLSMQLVYQKKYSDGKATGKAYLAYQPADPSLMINAVTGERITEETVTDMGGRGEEDAIGQTSGNSKDSGLSKAEQQKLEKMKKLISQEQAVAAVRGKPELAIDATMTDVSAMLQQNWEKDGYIWSLNFYGANNDKGFVEASVDAETGTLLGFCRYGGTDSQNLGRYSDEQCRKTAEDFIKQEHPEYQKRIRYWENRNTIQYITEESSGNTKPAVYSFTYVDSHKDIPYLDNEFWCMVHTGTGKIMEYRMEWDDSVTFEKSDGCMSAEEALERYLDLWDMMPKFMITDDSGSREATPIYNDTVWPNNLSPFTGKQLNYGGEAYEAPQTEVQYKDIQDSPYRKEIKKLAELGAGVSGTKFRPNKAITKKEFCDWAEKLNLFYDKTPAGAESNKPLTRMNAAKYCMMLLGQTKSAKLEGIYGNVYEDMNAIPKKNRGYAALAKGFGLFPERKFDPDKNVSRGEAARILLQLLKVK